MLLFGVLYIRALFRIYSVNLFNRTIGPMNPIRNKLKSLKTLPNKLTAGRILVIPILLVLYPLTHEYIFSRIFCASLFALAAITDFFDGYLARKYDNTSKLGALLDPIADKILATCAVVLLVGSGQLPAFFGGVLLCREVTISGLRMAALELDFKIEVSQLGKYKTVVQDVAFVCLMVGTKSIHDIGMIGVWLALFISLYSAYEYSKSFWRQGKFAFVEKPNEDSES